MVNIDTIQIPWDVFPSMKVWRVVRKISAPDDTWKFRYEPAESRYKGYPHRKEAIEEARRLTAATGVEHVTIRAYLVACEQGDA